MATATQPIQPSSASGIAPAAVEPGPAVHDFDFLFGTWRIRHRRLVERLAGREQAFSTDDGAAWEVNWVMEFSRAD